MSHSECHRQILNVLDALRDAVPNARHHFTSGCCYRLYLLLKAVWPHAIAWYDGNHVVTQIHGRFYDITGRVFIKHHTYRISQEPRIARTAHRWGKEYKQS